MNQKFTHLLRPRDPVYLAVLLLFGIITAFFSLRLAGAEFVCVLVLWFLSRRGERRVHRELGRVMEHVTVNVDAAARDVMVNAPLPMAIFRPDSGEIIWTNERFLAISGDPEHLFESKISALVPDFDTRWLMEDKNISPGEVALGERRFRVYGHLQRTSGKDAQGFMATTYWVDVSEYSTVCRAYDRTRPVAAVILIDNYEDLMKNLTDNDRSTLLAEIDARLDNWLSGTGSLLRRYQRERYLMVCQRQHLDALIERKFEILDTVRQVKNSKGITASLSIGVGTDGESFAQLLEFANLSIDMALSRGGDQAVIRSQETFAFYGGHAAETEKRSKVKSRVMASSLSALLTEVSAVFVMGHRQADMDATGAAVGICVAARKKGVPAFILQETPPPPSQPLIDRLMGSEEYRVSFLDPQEALLRVDEHSLVVVVDTNRPEQVQVPELLKTKARLAVIDHHRRAATYIEETALNYHEPYASSACELVTELLQYIVEPADLVKLEAEALLAGIVLDTKNFTMRTGARTFEAAAFLRRSGADTASVKRLFLNDLDATIAKYGIIQNARLYREHIAIAASERAVGRVTASQAADELLNIIGIQTSFVLFSDGERINISARSMGDTNVQVILEPLGGGGNAAAAGAQIPGRTLQEVSAQLTASIDRYLAEEEESGEGNETQKGRST